MANRMISTEDVETYNTDITSLVTEIDNVFTSVKKYAEKIDSIGDECGVKSDNKVSSYYTEDEDPAEDIENNSRVIKSALEQALEKAQKNDTTLKDKMTERSNEINQLKGIISQYKTHVESPTPTASLAGGLSAIGKANFIDRIPGVIEGRQKRVEAEIDANIMFLSDEEILAKIKANYRNLSDEDTQVLMQYYKLLNLPEELRNTALNGQKPILMNVDGQYVLKFIDSDLKYKQEIMKGTGSLDLKSKVTMKPGDDGSIKTSGSISAGGKVSGYSVSYGNDGLSVGNVSASASATATKDKMDVGISVGVSAAEYKVKKTIYQDDLYRYGLDVTISAFSANLSAKLKTGGFEVGGTTGVIGVSVSGGRSDLIDTNVDM